MPAVRRRDAEGTRRRLLTAAGELFADRGYASTTVREIGQRAQADPALIARYFGGKVGLYLAALRERTPGQSAASLLDPDRLTELIGRAHTISRGPILPAAVQPHHDPAVQDAVKAELAARLVQPLQEELHAAGVPSPQLQAELTAAAIIGIVLTRSAGTFPQLSAADPEVLASHTHHLLQSLTAEPERPGRS